MERFERIGLQIMNRARPGSPMDGRSDRPVLGDPAKRRAAAQILGQAYITAVACMRHNREAVAERRRRARAAPRAPRRRGRRAARGSPTRGAGDRRPRRGHLAQGMSERDDETEHRARPGTRPARGRSTIPPRCCPQRATRCCRPTPRSSSPTRSTRTPAATCCPSAAARPAPRPSPPPAPLRPRPALPVPHRRPGRRRRRGARGVAVADRRHAAARAATGRRGRRGGRRRRRRGRTQIAAHVGPALPRPRAQLVSVAGQRPRLQGHAADRRAARDARAGRRHPGLRREGRALPAVRAGRELRDRPRQALDRARPAAAPRGARARAVLASATSTSSRSSCSSPRPRARPDRRAVLPPATSAPRARPAAERVAARRRRRGHDRHPVARRALVDQTDAAVPLLAQGSASTTAASSCSTPTATAADRKLQKRLQAQQKQAAAAAASAADRDAGGLGRLSAAARARSRAPRRAWPPSTCTRGRCGCAACGWSARRGSSACRGSGASTATRCGT